MTDSADGKTLPPEASQRPPTYFEYVQFGISVLFLLVLIWLGNLKEDSQYNVMFLTLLSLACGSFFVFLPVSAALDLKWLKATGGAAIFGATMWITIPNAQRHNDAHDKALTELKDTNKQLENAKSSIDQLNKQNEKLIGDAKASNEHANKLQAECIGKIEAKTNGEADAASKQSELLKSYFATIRARAKDAQAATSAGMSLALAAASNTSDNATCTYRGTQAATALKGADTNLQIINQTVEAALGAVK